jgi:hypothetical protein
MIVRVVLIDSLRVSSTVAASKGEGNHEHLFSFMSLATC